MSLINDIFKFIVRYRLHIGLLAGMTATVPFGASLDGIVTAQGINWNAVLAGLAMGMLVTSINLFNKLADAGADASDPRTLPFSAQEQRIALKLAQGLTLVPVIWLLLMPPVLIVYLVAAGLGYAFNYGFTLGGARRRLKGIFFIKNLLPAFSYALCVAAPYALLASDAVPTIVLLHAVSAFTMILLHEMLGDMRDIAADKKAGIRTLPNTMGINVTKGFGLVVMIAYVGYIYLVTGVPAPNLPPTFVVMAAIFLVGSDKRGWAYYQSYIFLWLAIVAIDLFV